MFRLRDTDALQECVWSDAYVVPNPPLEGAPAGPEVECRAGDVDGILDVATGRALWKLLYFGERNATPDGDPKASAERVIGHQA
jgi:hypothetical protein